MSRADETFSVNLTAAENAVILDGQGVGTLLNDDGAPAGSLQFSVSEYSISEGAGTATITVTCQGGSVRRGFGNLCHFERHRDGGSGLHG